METEIKTNIFVGSFMVIVGLLVFSIVVASCLKVEEISPPKPADMHVILDASSDLGLE